MSSISALASIEVKPDGHGVFTLHKKPMKKTMQLPPVRVSEDEYNLLAIAASKADRKLSDWMRRALIASIDSHESTMRDGHEDDNESNA